MAMTLKLENPWDVESLYEFQYFVCPSCLYKHGSKQDFVCHAFDNHPECVIFFENIRDGSINDILCPWDSTDNRIETVNRDQEIDDNNFHNTREFEEPWSQTNNENDSEPFETVDTNQEVELDDNNFHNTIEFEERWSQTNNENNSKPFDNTTENSSKDMVEILNVEENHSNSENLESDTENRIANSLNEQEQKKEEAFPTEEKHSNRENLRIDFEDGIDIKKLQFVDYIELISNKEEKKEEEEITYHAGAVHKCDCCDSSFTDEKYLQLHILLHPKCDKCGKKFKSQKLLKKHDKIEHMKSVQQSEDVKNNKKVKCDHCDLYLCLGNLKRHIRVVHEAIRDIKCPHCTLEFLLYEHLRSHIFKVHDGKKIDCDSCEKSFLTSGQLQKHKNNNHEKPKVLMCEQCSTTFREVKCLNKHIRRVSSLSSLFKYLSLYWLIHFLLSHVFPTFRFMKA